MCPQASVNDLPVGRSVDETLRLVTAFQYVDANAGDEEVLDSHPGGTTRTPHARAHTRDNLIHLVFFSRSGFGVVMVE